MERTPLKVSAVETVHHFRNKNDDEAPKEARAYKGGPPDAHDKTRNVSNNWPPQTDTQYEYNEEEEGFTHRNEESESQMTDRNLQLEGPLAHPSK